MNWWGRIKQGLETPEKGAGTMTLRLTDLAVVTYAVPTARVLPHLPPGFTPDQLPSADGDLVSFAQTTCAFCLDARWSPAPLGTGRAYREITYRILGRRTSGHPAAFLVRSFYSADQVYLASRAVQRDADFARVSVQISGDPVRGIFTGYKLRATADRGTTEWEVATRETEDAAVPAPFGNLPDMAHFLLRREATYFKPSAAPKGWLGFAPAAFPAQMPPPTLGVLKSARLTPWRELGVLSLEEMTTPHSVLFVPALSITAYPPRPVKSPA